MNSSKKMAESTVVSVLQRKKYSNWQIIQTAFARFSAASASTAVKYFLTYLESRFLPFDLRE